MNKNTPTYPFIDTILHNKTPYTPIWLMRQAGRYLPEYRAMREKAGSFLNLCKNPDLATQITLQPLKRFSLDAAILFSDILVVPEALGMELTFINGEGPKFTSPIANEVDIDNLDASCLLEKLSYVFATIKNIKRENLKVPLIGFSGSPFTLACYMVGGTSKNDFWEIKEWIYKKPVLLHKLLNKLTEAVIIYLNKQIESGADTVMLFDSWGGILSNSAYVEYSLQYSNKIIQQLIKHRNNQDIPNIVFTKGGGVWLDKIAAIGSNVIGLDWTVDIAKARKDVARNVTFQGNLDPVLLALGDRAMLRKETENILNNYKNANNGSITSHIFNLGHGVLPTTNPDNVAYLVDLVHELSTK